MNPILISTPDYGLGCGTHYQLLLKASLRVYYHAVALGVVLKTIMCNNSTLLGETLHVFGLATKERFGNKQREVCVLHSGLLEHFIKGLLHLLPNGVAIRLYDHAAAHGALLGKVRLDYEFIVPLRVVFSSFSKILKFFSHYFSLLY